MIIDTNWDGVLGDKIIPVDGSKIEILWQGKIVRSQIEEFNIFGIETKRELIAHPGAIGVIAVNSKNEIALIRQYRHPVKAFLFEPIAGLLDKPDETYLAAAQRELLEEAGLVSTKWSHLVDLALSPGGSTELIRFFLAEDVSISPNGRIWSHESEEKEMPVYWVSRSEFVAAVLTGRLHNSPGIAAGSTAFEQLQGNQRSNPAIDWPMFNNIANGFGVSTINNESAAVEAGKGS